MASASRKGEQRAVAWPCDDEVPPQTRTTLTLDELEDMACIRKYVAYNVAVEVHKRMAWSNHHGNMGSKKENLREIRSRSLGSVTDKSAINSLLEHAAVKRHDLLKSNEATVFETARDMGFALSPTKTAELEAELESDQRLRALLENIGQKWKWEGKWLSSLNSEWRAIFRWVR